MQVKVTTHLGTTTTTTRDVSHQKFVHFRPPNAKDSSVLQVGCRKNLLGKQGRDLLVFVDQTVIVSSKVQKLN